MSPIDAEVEFVLVVLKDWPPVVMASKHGSRSKKLGSSSSRAANSLSSSTTSSSKQNLETSIEAQSSPASSSARSKPQYFYSESLPQNVERSKENVTVTVRFRPLRCDSQIWVYFTYKVSWVLNKLAVVYVWGSPREIRQGEEIAWYADGETILRNEHNPSIAYAYGILSTFSYFYSHNLLNLCGGEISKPKLNDWGLMYM